ncbi:phage baseplate protein [candidate division LCP-89 bacterium B3_LCP]|uniref:Phage baseplate protein n=1 Tax=candidate division LCP-89 bacterium B3_LCP TaxID=2012998 RepID=A0A532UUA8_UNCL8|nr:MAG: phage baseplate protein [candidate division LCP-89 bacterium B3_LCP]
MSANNNRNLANPEYLAFPFRIDEDGGEKCDRAAHVRQQIEQVLYTNPYERIFRPEFGVGLKKLVFEPNSSALAEITKKRLQSSLAEALKGEVDPKTIVVDVNPDEEKLIISVSYTLATIGTTEQHEFLI